MVAGRGNSARAPALGDEECPREEGPHRAPSGLKARVHVYVVPSPWPYCWPFFLAYPGAGTSTVASAEVAASPPSPLTARTRE